MDGILLAPLDAEPADLAVLVIRLLAEVDQLRAEVAGLRRENLELRQQAGYWRSRHADAVRRMAALEQENEQLRGEIRKLQAERFGRRSEKQSAAAIARMISMTPRKTSRNVNAVGSPVSRLRHVAITAICPLGSRRSTCRKPN